VWTKLQLYSNFFSSESISADVCLAVDMYYIPEVVLISNAEVWSNFRSGLIDTTFGSINGQEFHFLDL
jgi:hypothetical protein